MAKINYFKHNLNQKRNTEKNIQNQVTKYKLSLNADVTIKDLLKGSDIKKLIQVIAYMTLKKDIQIQSIITRKQIKL